MKIQLEGVVVDHHGLAPNSHLVRVMIRMKGKSTDLSDGPILHEVMLHVTCTAEQAQKYLPVDKELSADSVINFEEKAS
jgi:hypothetical protein